MTTDDIDIWRAAKLLIDRHGDAATVEAMNRADALAARGDVEDEAVGLRILEAVKELQSTVPSGAVHLAHGLSPQALEAPVVPCAIRR